MLGHLEAHRRVHAQPALEAEFHRLQQVLGVGLVECEIGVARHAERIARHDLHARKQLLRVRGDQLIDRQESRAVGQRDPAREQRRNLDAREAVHLRVGIAHDHREVERQVRDVRKRMGGIDRERREHREDPRREHVRELALLRGGEVVPAGEPDAEVAQPREQILVQDVVEPRDLTDHERVDRGELLGR